MSRLDVIRAWKDEEYFGSLSEAERMLMPQNPAGFVVLSDDELRSAKGAALGSCHTCLTGTTTACEANTLTITPPLVTAVPTN